MGRIGAAILGGLAAVTLACSGAPASCADIPMEEAVAAEQRTAASGLDFSPLAPCSSDGSLRVERVFVDTLPADPPLPRINFIVERRGERAFILSQRRAPLPFTQIPQGAHRLRVTAANAVADGFAGPSGSGPELAYLRWRTAGITFELAADLHPWQTERDVQATAAALMGRAPP